jgi:hypothetical protein
MIVLVRNRGDRNVGGHFGKHLVTAPILETFPLALGKLIIIAYGLGMEK